MDDDEEPRFVICLDCETSRSPDIFPCQCGSERPPFPVLKTGLWGLSLDDTNSYLMAIGCGTPLLIRQRHAWIGDYVHRAGRLLSSQWSGADFLELYWVRLHGVLTELGRAIRTEERSNPNLPSAGPLPAHHTQGLSEAVLEALDAHVNALTCDQLVFADYQRHRSCHVHQIVFFPQIESKKRRLKEKYRLESTGELLEWGQRCEAVNRVLERHPSAKGGDPFEQLACPGAALEIAKALAPAVSQLVEAWLKFQEVALPLEN